MFVCFIYTSADFAEAKPSTREDETTALCITLPGKTLYLTPLLAMKKFRKKGKKEGAIRAFYRLQEEGLGRVLEVAGSKGTSAVSILISKCM